MPALTVGALYERIRPAAIAHLGERSPRTLNAYECGYDAGLADFGVDPGDVVACAITNTKQAMPVTGVNPLLTLWGALALLGGGALVLVLGLRRRRSA